MHRILSTLRARGYVSRDPLSACYGVGLRVAQLAQQSDVAESTTGACWPAMRWLWNMAGETVMLTVRANDMAVLVEKIDSRQLAVPTCPLGQLMPFHTVASGMALVAFLGDDEIRTLLAEYGPVQRSASPQVAAQSIWTDLQSVRRRRYAINRERFRENICGVAAPVWGRDVRRPAGALAVCVPSSHFESRLDALCESVVMAAAKASEALTCAQ